MLRLRKIFHKDSPVVDHPRTSPTKPVYRGTKPLTVADIHSHCPVEQTRLGDGLDYYYDNLGTRRSQPRKRDSDEVNVLDILDRFPAPQMQPVISSAHKDGPRFYFPHDQLELFPSDELLPPPPDKVLELIKERDRAQSHTLGRLEHHQRTPSPAVPPHHGQPSTRRPLYANAHANLSTHSLGAHPKLKSGSTAPRAMVQQPGGHGNSPSQRAHTVSPGSRPSTRPEARHKLPTIPEGERQRLRSAPTQFSSRQLAAANQELYQAYPSTFQGQPRRQYF